MHALLISLALLGQAEVGLPPAPAADPTSLPVPAVGPATERIEDLKTWLLARLIVDMSFDAQKSAEVGRLIDTMNEQQLRVLIAAYKERAAKLVNMLTPYYKPLFVEVVYCFFEEGDFLFCKIIKML